MTVFKSTGHAAEDVAVAAVVLRRARAAGAGTAVVLRRARAAGAGTAVDMA